MSGIAEILLNMGYPVSGSDIKKSSTTTRLKKLGAQIHIGHKEKNIENADVVVYSSAVNKSNPEVTAAKKKNIPVIRRAEMLAEVMRLKKYGIAVAGTHGKTTTTSLLSSILYEGGIDPTMVIGGKVKDFKTNAKSGNGDFICVEADESDGSFLHLFPTIAVVTNIDPDHMENYNGFEDYKNAFKTFCEKVPFYGLVVLCGEHPETKKLSKTLDRRVVTYGFSKKFDWNAQNISYDSLTCTFELYNKETFIDNITLNLAGKHNILNSLAAICVAQEIGISKTRIRMALKKFQGVGRRLEILFKDENITAIDDYAHHPEEIKATLRALKNTLNGRLVVLFQPHRYSRLKDLFDDFTTSFDDADQVFITKVYSAGEQPITGVNSTDLVNKMEKTHKNTAYLSSDQVIKKINDTLKPGDVFLTLGAGDITKTAKEIAKQLKNFSKNISDNQVIKT